MHAMKWHQLFHPGGSPGLVSGAAEGGVGTLPPSPIGTMLKFPAYQGVIWGIRELSPKVGGLTGFTPSSYDLAKRHPVLSRAWHRLLLVDNNLILLPAKAAVPLFPCGGRPTDCPAPRPPATSPLDWESLAYPA